MQARASIFRILLVLFQVIFLVTNFGFSNQTDGADFTVYDLIDAVNGIRISKGLPSLQTNSILMNVAQSHSDYQASLRRSTHAGRSGEIVNDRVVAAGYGAGEKIVAGENVANLDIGIPGMLHIIVFEIWSDAGHWGAMINPKYQDIGAGIASDGKSIYVTLNLGGIVSDNLVKPTPLLTLSPQTEPNLPGNPAILPLYTSTPLADGSVYHTVGYGQTLNTIARIYQVDIKELIQLNQIEPDKIYSGQKLLIKTAGPLLPTDKSTSTISPILQSTPTLKPAVSSTSTTLPTPTTTPEPINTKEIGIITIYTLFGVLAIIILFISRGNRPPS